jgi:ribonuclease P/MRP protein subunit RPP40
MLVIVLAQKLPEEAKSWNTLGPKQKAALELYDKLRFESGLDSWEVLYHCTKQGDFRTDFRGSCNSCRADVLQPEHEFIKTQSQFASISDIHIPVPDLSPPPREDEDGTEDWNENISQLFEWVGMAGLGSQR